jgi:hypothetical protein
MRALLLTARGAKSQLQCSALRVACSHEQVAHFQGKKNSMCLRSQSNGRGTLFDGLQSVFYLVQSTLRREDGIVGIVRVTELYIYEVSVSVVRGRISSL